MSEPGTDFHADFAGYLRSGDPSGLAHHLRGDAALGRLAVYRNNVVRGAIEALRAAYPAVNRLVGVEFFTPMAKAYWEACPPSTPSLTLYGEGFAAHVAGWDAARGLPWLADVARHDRAWLLAHHAPDAPALAVAAVTSLPAEDLPDLRPGLQASVHILSCGWSAYPIWTANRTAADPDRPARLEARAGRFDSLLWREGGEVRHSALTPGEADFLTSLATGTSLAEAADRGLATDPGLGAAALFGRALGAGWLSGVSGS